MFLPFVKVNDVPVQMQKSKMKDKEANLRILRVELSKAEAETAGISQEHFNSGSAKNPPRFERTVVNNKGFKGWWKEASEGSSTRDPQHMEGRTWTLSTRIEGVHIVEMTAAEVAEFKKKK